VSSLSADGFDVPDGIGPLASGTSVLLTGDDADALESVFARVVAPADGERSVVLTTEHRGRAVQRTLNGERRGAGDRAAVMAAEGAASGDDITAIDDLADLTGLGMAFSSLVAEAQQETERFRTGIYLCSTVASEIDDTRSLYRFLNSNFLTELRRGNGIGVCAIDTSADIGADVESTVTGLKTSFKTHIDVDATDRRNAELAVDGPDGERTLDVAL